MNLKSRVSFIFALVNLIIFFGVKSFVLVGFVQSSMTTRVLEFMCLLIFMPLFWSIFNDLKKSYKTIKYNEDYSKKLNTALVLQSNADEFYNGDVNGATKMLTESVAKTIDADRVSIWLYNDKRDRIELQDLYVKLTNEHFKTGVLYKSDFKPYFECVENEFLLVANDVSTHKGTKCLMDKYCSVVGVKSMLDITIWLNSEMVGVICIESLTPRTWLPIEIDFTQILSSLYSFVYSVKEANLISNDLLEFERFIDKATLVSRTDANGKITYVNKRFEEVSGWKLKDVLGKDHSILNSGEHPKEMWAAMYKRVVKEKKIWNGIVTNKRKNGQLYYVDTYIKAEFSEDDKLCGFISVRHDVTEVIKNTQEISKKNTYLEHAAKILRHDMHSGINTYIPRGISSLKRRLNDDVIKSLKLEAPLRMLEEGLTHTQKVYKGVYEFTNLVKADQVLNKEEHNLKNILQSYLSNTSYKSQVIIDNLPVLAVNESLFCTAVDNLIRNGLKYNDSNTKFVKIFMDSKNVIAIQDNGRGLTQEEFEQLSKPYTRKPNQKENGTGLGLNICIAILNEHGFGVSCEKNETGTKFKIKLKP
jgi:PAS domain S-box-containing protein